MSRNVLPSALERVLGRWNDKNETIIVQLGNKETKKTCNNSERIEKCMNIFNNLLRQREVDRNEKEKQTKQTSVNISKSIGGALTRYKEKELRSERRGVIEMNKTTESNVSNYKGNESSLYRQNASNVGDNDGNSVGKNVDNIVESTEVNRNEEQQVL